MSLSQWERFLKNVGTWQGSFAEISPQGEVMKTIPSEVIFKSLNRGQLIRQETHQRPTDAAPNKQVLEYRNLNKGHLLFENGAFSNGPIQWRPFSDFSVELGLIQQDRRIRLVQRYTPDSSLKTLTLIREQTSASPSPMRPPLQLQDLIGTWESETITIYPNYRPDNIQTTQLTIEQLSEEQILQTTHFGDGRPHISSTGTIEGSILRFQTGKQPVQALLLPDGISSVCPSTIQTHHPFFLELGWLIEPHLRQRMIRQYNAAGAWVSLTLVTELKV